MVNNVGEKEINDDFARREQEFAKKSAILLQDDQPIPRDLLIEGTELCIQELKKVAAMPESTPKFNGLTAQELIENLQAGKSESQKFLHRYIRGAGNRYHEEFDAKCAQAVAANNVPDELKAEAAELLISSLRADPKGIVSCMCGECIYLTTKELADNLAAKGSEYEEQTEIYIRGCAVVHGLNLEKLSLLEALKDPKEGFFKKFFKKLFS